MRRTRARRRRARGFTNRPSNRAWNDAWNRRSRDHRASSPPSSSRGVVVDAASTGVVVDVVVDDGRRRREREGERAGRAPPLRFADRRWTTDVVLRARRTRRTDGRKMSTGWYHSRRRAARAPCVNAYSNARSPVVVVDGVDGVVARLIISTPAPITSALTVANCAYRRL